MNNNEFAREDRYIVIKSSDLHAADKAGVIAPAVFDALCALDKQLPPRQFVVVESDWPEYETVWRMIENRATGIAPSGDMEAPTTVGALILGGAASSTELGDNDVTLDNQVVDRLQRELVKDSEDLAVELMLVDQHYRILQALRAERDVALAAVAQILSMLGVTDQVQAGERIGFLVGQSIMVPKLESRLTALEKQEPIGWWAQYCETPMRRMVHWGAKLPECATDTFYPFYAAPIAQAGQVPEEWRNALERLERACDKRAELTSSEAYSLASQATGMRDALLELDNARLAARQLLAAAPTQRGE